MQLKVGTRLQSTVCDTEVIVVRAPDKNLDLTCGGQPMVSKDERPAAIGNLHPDLAGGSLLGKRYAVEDLGLELLVTKGGDGSLAIDDRPLAIKEPKRLPTSD